MCTAVLKPADEYNAELDSKGVDPYTVPVKGYERTLATWRSRVRRGQVRDILDHSIDPVIGLYSIINLLSSLAGRF